MNIYGILNMEMRKLKWGRDVCGVSGGRWSGFLYDTHNDTPTSLSGARASPKKVNIALERVYFLFCGEPDY